MIVLFQQQDGVDVCLYCIYVQEYGDDCAAPNTCAPLPSPAPRLVPSLGRLFQGLRELYIRLRM